MLHRQKEHLRGPLEVRLEEKAKRLHPLFPLFHCDPHWRGWHPDHFLQIILICSHSNRFCWSACIDAAAIVALTVNCVQPEAVALQRSWQNNLCPLRLRMRKKKEKSSETFPTMNWTWAEQQLQQSGIEMRGDLHSVSRITGEYKILYLRNLGDLSNIAVSWCIFPFNSV